VPLVTRVQGKIVTKIANRLEKRLTCPCANYGLKTYGGVEV
jgi:hypothetical protein